MINTLNIDCTFSTPEAAKVVKYIYSYSLLLKRFYFSRSLSLKCRGFKIILADQCCFLETVHMLRGYNYLLHV